MPDLSRNDEQAAVQGQGLDGSTLCRVQGLAGDEALLFAQQLHVSTESDDISLRLCIALWTDKQQSTKHRCQWQVQPCTDCHVG